MRFKIERANAPAWIRPVIPLVAILVTFIITSVFILWAKANPFVAYYNFLIAPLSNQVSALEVLVKGTPLLLTGAAVTFAFSAGYYNIGAEGQLLAGAIAAAGLGMVLGPLPAWINIPIMLVGGFAAGMLWALIPALLKVKLMVDEVVTTLLMNTVITFFISWLLNGYWRDPISMQNQSATIAPSTTFPRLLPHSRLHLGFLVALLVILVIYFVIRRTPLGLRMRAVGLGKNAANFNGVKVGRTMLTAALISGGIAGMAGVGEVAGIHFHLIAQISPGYGYTGIIAATLGGLNPLGVGLGALFIGLIDTGAQTVSSAMGIPIYLGNVVQATLLLVTLGMFTLQNYRIKVISSTSEKERLI
jgi:general nucleoside transport system permease protein